MTEDAWSLPVEGTPARRSLLDRALKTALDRGGAAALLLATSPLSLAAALAIWRQMGSPVLYRQKRPGFQGRPIRVWKFRTMTNERDAEGKLLPDDERLTALGRFLRETSLDELPQLVNVLLGDMSLVGPRPLLMRYLPRYSPRQRLRHFAKPGITGWAQVHGRNALDWDSRLELDVWYVENASIVLDLEILVRTLLQLTRREDVKAGGSADFDEFWGSEEPPDGGVRAFPSEEDEPAPV